MSDHSARSNAQLRTAIDEAAHWFVKLQETDGASEHTIKKEWQQWLGASDHNRNAWARVQVVQQRFAAVPGVIALPTLTQAGRKRRNFLKAGAGVLAVPLAWWMLDLQAWPQWTADLATARGQIRSVSLPDGSLAILDTDSAMDIAFDNTVRKLILRQGGIYVKTAADPMALGRPFIVQTPHGQVRALGTEFVVRAGTGSSDVKVNQHAVLVAPTHGHETAVLVNEGYRATFSEEGVSRPETIGDRIFVSWRNGSLVVHEVSMGELVQRRSPIALDTWR